MKKTIVILFVVTVFVFAFQVSAKEEERIGEKLNIYSSGNITFPPNTPFHVVHGWYDFPNGRPAVLSEFKLMVDGEYLDEDFIELFVDKTTGINKAYVFNFLEGMTGQHRFDGFWFERCTEISSDCKNPSQTYLAYSSTVTVTFTNPYP